MKRALLFALGVVLSAPAGAATKYISPTGSALWAACTSSDVRCPLSTALTSAAPGDLIWMGPGNYGGFNTATNGTAAAPIVWRAEEAGQAVIDGITSTDKTLVVDNNYHEFYGVRVNVPTGPGNANVFGFFATGAGWKFIDGEITYTGDEAATGVDNIIYCGQIRSAGVFSGNFVHRCTYGLSVFSTSAGFAATVEDNIFEDMTVGDDEDSDCMAVSGAGIYDWSGLVFRRNDCSGYRDDGIDMLLASYARSEGNRIHHPSSANDANLNSSCLKMGGETSTSNRSKSDYCYGLTDDPAMRNYGYVFTGSNNSVAESSIVDRPFRCADIAQRNGSGGANNTIEHMTCPSATEAGVKVYSGATGTAVRNSILGGDAAAIDVASGLTVTGTTNRLVTGAVSGAGTYNGSGDTTGDPEFIGGNRPTSPYGFRPTNPEVCTGAVAARGASWDGQRFRQGGQIGAMACRSDAIR